MIFVIGDGSMVNMWVDPWLRVHPPRAPRSLSGNNDFESVRNYILDNGAGWNVEKLREKVVPEDVEVILSLKLSSRAQMDLLGWHYTDNGIYTVKTGYWLSTHLPDNAPIEQIWGDPLIKQKVRKLSSPPKSNISCGERYQGLWQWEVTLNEDMSQDKSNV